MPTRLDQIFDDKNWNFRSTDGSDDHYKNKYFLYKEMFKRLSPDEIFLVLKLTELYLYIPFNNYFILSSDLAKTVAGLITPRHKETFIVSLSDPEHRGYIKSGSFIAGLLKPAAIRNEYNLDRIPLHFIDIQDVLRSDFSTRTDSLVIFVDDFIGSADTAISALSYFDNNIRIQSDDLHIATFVTMELAKINITNKGYNLISMFDLKRGISDSGAFDNPPKYLGIMDKIEDKLGISAYYRLGYKQTEATLSLANTPDNTFPVFWCTKDAQGNNWPAPFPEPGRG